MTFLSSVVVCASLLGCAGGPAPADGRRRFGMPAEPPLICRESLHQSPIHILRQDLTYLTSGPGELSVQAVVAPSGPQGVNLTIKNSHVLGVPDYEMFLSGRQVRGNYDLYVFQVYPVNLHVIEGLDTPYMELHMKFIRDAQELTGRGVYTVKKLTEAARKNTLVAVAQLVSQLPRGESRNKDPVVNGLVDCLLRLTVGHSVVCQLPLDMMLDLSAGFYYYRGSLMYPNCEETVKYIVLNRTIKMSGEHIRTIKRMMPYYPRRPQQPLNGRWVEFHSFSSSANVAYSSAPWIVLVGWLPAMEVFSVFGHLAS